MPQPQPNMQQMLKQVQKMQADMVAAQEELKDEVVEASAGGGMVTVKVTGELVVQVDQDRPRGGRPRRRRDARGHGAGRRQRGDAARRRSWRPQKLGAVTGGLGGPGWPRRSGLPGF